MRSEIVKRILSETPDHVREEVKQIANKMVEDNKELCPTCGTIEGAFCSNSFHKKSPETKMDFEKEIIDKFVTESKKYRDPSCFLIGCGYASAKLKSELTKLREENESQRREIIKLGDMVVDFGKILLKPSEREQMDKLVQENEELRKRCSMNYGGGFTEEEIKILALETKLSKAKEFIGDLVKVMEQQSMVTWITPEYEKLKKFLNETV